MYGIVSYDLSVMNVFKKLFDIIFCLYYNLSIGLLYKTTNKSIMITKSSQHTAVRFVGHLLHILPPEIIFT